MISYDSINHKVAPNIYIYIFSRPMGLKIINNCTSKIRGQMLNSFSLKLLLYDPVYRQPPSTCDVIRVCFCQCISAFVGRISFQSH